MPNTKTKSKTDASSSSQASRPTRPNRQSMAGGRDDDNITETEHDDDFGAPKTLVKPDDQLQLTEAELKEEFTRILTANNPHAPHNVVRFDFKERGYKVVTAVDQLAIHFAMDGNMIHMESDEAKRQLAGTTGEEGPELAEEEEAESEAEEKTPSATTLKETPSKEPGEEAEAGEGGEEEEGGEGGEGEGGEGEGGEGEDEESKPTKRPAGGKGDKKLTNQFNFSERASQTYNNPLRDRGNVTEPPPRKTFSGNVSQWEIFDAYAEDFEIQMQEKLRQERLETKAKKPKKEDEHKKKKTTISDMQGEDIISMIGPAAKIIERMVNQNIFDDITQDFKYYDDAADEFRDQEGTLLPLWKFTHEKVQKKMAVTAMSWSPKYMDMFACGHGSYDFLKQQAGLILFYSLKNPSYPEFIYATESGVMSLDIHKDFPYLIAVGFYDGNVAVYNLVENKTAPVYISTAKTGKHTDPVWQVRWQKEDLDNNLNFYSISSDGRVVSWTLLKHEIHYHDVIHLMRDDLSAEGPDGTQLVTLGGGTAFDFHREKDHLYLVGSEEGRVHVCSKAYSSTFLDTYEAHHMAVYSVSWNHYHPRLFITCSADWSVKIWDRTTDSKEPAFTFDLGSPVGDVAWAPYSSTVFAAVTADGKVHVFDLNVNKYESICEQLITPKKKTKLTHVAFNPKFPVLIVGDDKGYVQSLKLSPNLRRQPKEKKGQENMKPEEKEHLRVEYELSKIEKLLSMVRQPDAKIAADVKPLVAPGGKKDH